VLIEIRGNDVVAQIDELPALRAQSAVANVKKSQIAFLVGQKATIQIGAKVTQHSKYVTFQLAEVAVPKELFAAILERIARLAMPPPLVGRAYA